MVDLAPFRRVADQCISAIANWLYIVRTMRYSSFEKELSLWAVR
jgi:hypothetical protein